RKKLKDCLALLNYTNVIEAADGDEAVSLFKQEKPNLVFMDIVMPKMFGTDAVKNIVDLDEEAIIVMLSSVGTKKHVQESIKVGARDFIFKPFTASRVAEILERYNQ
ncbi:MAG: hypothetical protein BHW17_07870, partial [Dorea sp. 42_8]